MFKNYNIKNYTDPYLTCPLCKKMFCNSFGERPKGDCKSCRKKQKVQFGKVCCNNVADIKIAHCKCGVKSSIDQSILVIYLMILLDYIDNLEYQLVCKKGTF